MKRRIYLQSATMLTPAGSSLQAQKRALNSATPLRSQRVWSQNPEHRARFAAMDEQPHQDPTRFSTRLHALLEQKPGPFCAESPIFVATSLGDMSTLERALAQKQNTEELDYNGADHILREYSEGLQIYTINTACSSANHAIGMARQSLLSEPVSYTHLTLPTTPYV